MFSCHQLASFHFNLKWTPTSSSFKADLMVMNSRLWFVSFIWEGLLSQSILGWQFFFFFLGLHPRHIEIPRLGGEFELQLPAYTTATETADPSHVCEPHHSSRQRQILDPLSYARDGAYNLMVPGWIRFHCTPVGTPWLAIFNPSSLWIRLSTVSWPLSFCWEICW